MIYKKDVAKPSFDALFSYLDERYERKDQPDTVDAIPIFKTKLFVRMGYWDFAHLSYSIKIKLESKGKITQLHISLDETKNWILAFLFAVFIGAGYFLSNPTSWAFISGGFAGMILYFILRYAARKGVIHFVKTNIIAGSTNNQ